MHTQITLTDAMGRIIERMSEKYSDDWIIACDSDVCKKQLIEKHISREKHFIPVGEIESHKFTEICVGLSGSFALQLKDSIINVKEGDVCIIFPGNPHVELPKKEESYTAVWVAIDFNRALAHLSGKSAETPFFMFDSYSLKSDYEFLRILKCIQDEIDCKNGYYNQLIKSYTVQFFVTAYREIVKDCGSIAFGHAWKESVVQAVQKYIKENYFKHIKLADVSQEVCISQNYLNALFKSVTGKTVIQYHEDYRIEMAKNLIKFTNASINHISAQLGYYDQYHFSKIFKKITGLSPSQYRKMKEKDYSILK